MNEIYIIRDRSSFRLVYHTRDAVRIKIALSVRDILFSK